MKLTPLSNPLRSSSKPASALQAGSSSSTSSSCILAPAGTYLAEVGVQKLTEHKRPLWVQTLANLLAMAVAGGGAALVVYWGEKEPAYKLLSLLVFFLGYFTLLWLYSWTYLREVGFIQRGLAVFAQMVLSLVLFATFFFFSSLIGWGILEMMGYQIQDLLPPPSA